MDAQYTTRFIAGVRTHADRQNAIHANRSALLGAYEAVVRGDFEDFGSSLTDDVELDIQGSGFMDGNWRGRRNVVEAARRNYGLVGQQKPEIESMIFQDDIAAVLFRETGVFTADSRPYHVRAVQWFHFEGGRIRRIDEVVAPHAGI